MSRHSQTHFRFALRLDRIRGNKVGKRSCQSHKDITRQLDGRDEEEAVLGETSLRGRELLFLLVEDGLIAEVGVGDANILQMKLIPIEDRLFRKQRHSARRNGMSNLLGSRLFLFISRWMRFNSEASERDAQHRHRLRGRCIQGADTLREIPNRRVGIECDTDCLKVRHRIKHVGRCGVNNIDGCLGDGGTESVDDDASL